VDINNTCVPLKVVSYVKHCATFKLGFATKAAVLTRKVICFDLLKPAQERIISYNIFGSAPLGNSTSPFYLHAD
jgi:hypothetical protein